jgi:hypothetical protein
MMPRGPSAITQYSWTDTIKIYKDVSMTYTDIRKITNNETILVDVNVYITFTEKINLLEYYRLSANGTDFITISQGVITRSNGTYYELGKGQTLSFTVEAEGATSLSIEDVVEVGVKVEFWSPLVHDVAVTDIQGVCCNYHSTQINKSVLCKNYTACINVTAKNEGDLTEITHVALWIENISTYQIGATIPVTLDSGEFKTVTFLFNSTNLPKGNYTIFANTTIVEGETDTLDNTFWDGWIAIAYPGDIDIDRHVFLYDLTILGTAWDSRPGGQNWNANADIDGDCHVFLYDLTIIGSHWDEQY